MSIMTLGALMFLTETYTTVSICKLNSDVTIFEGAAVDVCNHIDAKTPVRWIKIGKMEMFVFI